MIITKLYIFVVGIKYIYYLNVYTYAFGILAVSIFLSRFPMYACADVDVVHINVI